MGCECLKGKPSLPMELMKTDHAYLESVFSLYNDIEENNTIVLHQKRNTGMTTALQLILSYYTLHYPEITVLNSSNSYQEDMKRVYKMFTGFMKLDCDINLMSNKIIFKHDAQQYCELSILSAMSFNIMDLRGLVVFDTSKVMNNYSKYDDLLKNKKKYDRLIFNFPKSDSIAKLAEGYKIHKQDVNIL